MSFRNDHDAAIARADALHAEAEKLRAEREELRAQRNQMRAERDQLSEELARLRSDATPSGEPHPDTRTSSATSKPDGWFVEWVGRQNSPILTWVVVIGMCVLPVALIIFVAYLLDPRGCIF